MGASVAFACIKFYFIFATLLLRFYETCSQNVFCDQERTVICDMKAVTDAIKAEQCVLEQALEILKSKCSNQSYIENIAEDFQKNISGQLDTAANKINEDAGKRHADLTNLQKHLNNVLEGKLKSLDKFNEKLLGQLSHITSAVISSSRILQTIKSNNVLVQDCWEIYISGKNQSGMYRVWPKGWKSIGSFYVYCDMENDGGGWTVVHRQDPNQMQINFSRSWTEYNVGFGDLKNSFWIGNDKLCCLTNQKEYVLRLKMSDKQNKTYWATYGIFLIAQRYQLYSLSVGSYAGNAGDILKASNGQPFSTSDKDNDGSPENCASLFSLGWWYSNCTAADTTWINVPDPAFEIESFEMKIRPLEAGAFRRH